ncbi:hypothetical protein [Brevibacillus agri]|uniref:hypothetical protein n=1 Tax=Brevibacillus agri TaxID=51101 RepID=UPI001EE4FFC1|nr:hypothetical protein [Brevibacillus agri]MCG5254760.1 hypothetical protein [Brevibacillus agri]
MGRGADCLGVGVSEGQLFWLSGCSVARLSGFPASRLHGFPTVRLHDFPTVQLHGFPTVQLHGFPTPRPLWLPLPAARLSDFLTVQPSNHLADFPALPDPRDLP